MTTRLLEDSIGAGSLANIVSDLKASLKLAALSELSVISTGFDGPLTMSSKLACTTDDWKVNTINNVIIKEFVFLTMFPPQKTALIITHSQNNIKMHLRYENQTHPRRQ
jgi:hypothetical protein